jgi:hypothetical protein
MYGALARGRDEQLAPDTLFLGSSRGRRDFSAEKEEIDMAWINPDARCYHDWCEVPSRLSGRAPIKRTDISIKGAVIDRLRINRHTKDDHLKVEVKRGVVIVQGVVRSRLAKRSVADECWDIAGVTDVSNQVDTAEEAATEVVPEPVRNIMTTEASCSRPARPSGPPLR